MDIDVKALWIFQNALNNAGFSGRELARLAFPQAIGSLAILRPSKIGHHGTVSPLCAFVNMGGTAVSWRQIQFAAFLNVDQGIA
jgi:hypothetical protein